ncbi:MAG: flagellar export chaperone FlgN [Syntrophaceae bacterium]
MLPITNYGEQAVKIRRNQPDVRLLVGDMNDMHSPEALEREKVLLAELIEYLEQEVTYVISGDVDTLEESMPHKKKILEAIAANRAGHKALIDAGEEGDGAAVARLKQELAQLWKKAGTLNETSKEMVNRRLTDIELRLEPFFAGLKKGYDKSGKAFKSVAHTIKSGV